MDVALVVLNMAGLRGSARLACTSRHWRQAAQHWRGCVLRVTFTYADIRRASDIAVCALARDCSALLRIDLAGSQLIGGASINALAASCPLLEEVQLPGIQELNSFFSWRITSQRELVKEENIVRLANGCPHLAVLRGPCSTFGDDALRALAQSCLQLRELTITPCPEMRVSDMGLVALAAHCHELRVLDLTGGTSDEASKAYMVSDHGVMAIARGCTALERANFRCYAGLTDESITTLASCCSNLLELNVGGCGLLTDRSLDSLQNCEHLRCLHYDEAGVTDAAVQRLLARCPHTVDLGLGLLVFNDPDHAHEHHA